MKKIVIAMMLLTIFSKVIGFARDIILSYFYGASEISDAYLISITIPIVIFGFIGTAIYTGYIPMYSKIESNKGIESANRYTNNLINLLVLICTIFTALGVLFTETLVTIFASGFDEKTLAIAITFTRIGLIGIYFSSLTYIFSGFLQIKGNYIIPVLLGFPMNFIIIISIFISTRVDIIYLAIGSLIATISQAVLLWPFLYRKGFRYKFLIDLKDESIRKMAYIAIPAIIGVSVNQLNVLVDRTIASQIVVGGISALTYANRLNGFVQGLFVSSITAVLYPTISRMAAEKNYVGLKKSLSQAIIGINFLIIPATVGMLMFSEPIIMLLFGRGAFDMQAVSMTSYALFFYSIGMIGIGLREVLSQSFYSLLDTKTPMINGVIAVVLNIILNIVLSRFLGIGGLALATSIAAIFSTVLLFISLRKKIGPFGLKDISISFIKILIASLVMGAIGRFFYEYLLRDLSGNFALVFAIGLSVIVYFIVIYFMKINEVDSVVKSLVRKLKKNNPCMGKCN